MKCSPKIRDQGSFHAPFAESGDLPNYRRVIFQAVYPDRVSSGSVNAELSSALFQSLAILTSRNRCSWSSTLSDLPESIWALILANIGADSPKGPWDFSTIARSLRASANLDEMDLLEGLGGPGLFPFLSIFLVHPIIL